jgi:hypothetical protein
LHPAAVSLPDLLAPHTYGQYSAKIRQFPIPGFVQRALGLDSVCYIDATADVALEVLALVKKRRAAIEDPPVFPIMPLQPVFHLKWLPLPKGVQVSGKAALEIVTMNTLCPLISVLLFHAAPSEAEPTVVEIVALSSRIGAPDHDRRLFHQDLVLVSGNLP